MELERKQCIPCKSGMPPLRGNELDEYLGHVQGWQLNTEKDTIHRRFAFKNYKQAWDFVNSVSVIAEDEQHHPDIRFGWGYCEIYLTTHAICGLHENDFIVAAKINALG